MLSLEILLSFIRSMTDRLDQGDEPWPLVSSRLSYKPADEVSEHSSGGTAMFNAKPKQGLAFLERSGIIALDSDASGSDDEKRTQAISRFLRHSTRLDKKLLGEFISRPDQVELLKAFIGLFDFQAVGIAFSSQHQ